jgi:hypothetical protein
MDLLLFELFALWDDSVVSKCIFRPSLDVNFDLKHEVQENNRFRHKEVESNEPLGESFPYLINGDVTSNNLKLNWLMFLTCARKIISHPLKN